MRLLDEETDRTLRKLALYLTPEEAREVRDALEQLLIDRETVRLEHVHVDDREYEHHLTLVVYTAEQVDELQPRYRRLIIDDQ
jgi:hypothetical protein